MIDILFLLLLIFFFKKKKTKNYIEPFQNNNIDLKNLIKKNFNLSSLTFNNFFNTFNNYYNFELKIRDDIYILLKLKETLLDLLKSFFIIDNCSSKCYNIKKFIKLNIDNLLDQKIKYYNDNLVSIDKNNNYISHFQLSSI